MANSLGALVVSLGLNAAEFTAGLTKSEYEAKKLADRIDKGIATAANLATIAIAGIGAAAGAAFFAVDKLVKQAGDFQDLAEKTGSSAEALASFAVAAKIGNAEMSAIADASIKLTKNLVGVDDEGKAAGAAIASLGLDLKAFKQLDPAAQMDAVAKAMAGFADGAGKTAVATALFGKTGAQLLPFLKELGEGVGRQNILTAAQIKLADEYADKQAKSRAELNLYAQALSTQAIGAVTAFTGALSEVAKELLNVDKQAGNLGAGDAITRFSERGAVALANMAEIAVKAGVYFVGLANTIGGAAAAVAAVGRGEFSIAGKIVDAVRADNRADREFLAKLDLAAKVEAKFRELRAGATTGDFSRLDRNSKGQVNYQGAQSAGAAARTSEAERYLENLIKQLQKTEELTLVETALRDIQQGRLAGITPKVQQQILDTARLIDLHKAEAESLKASEAAAKKAADAAGELFRQATQFALAVETPAEKLTRQMEELNKAVENNPLISNDIAARSAQKYWEDFVKTLDVAKTTLTEADQFAKHAAENIQDYLGQGLFDVLSGNFQNIGKSFTNMINRMIAEAASAKISRYLFGDLLKGGEGSGGSGVLGGFISSIAGAFFGASTGGGGLTTGDFARLDRRAAGGPVDAGGMYRVNENGPEVLDVNGRQYLMMGNQRGTVIPNDRMGSSGGGTVIFNVNVREGTPRETGQQIAAFANQRLAAGRRGM